jgi:hypothetical protein
MAQTGNKIPQGYEQGQLQQFSPEQMQLFQQLFQHLGPNSFLSKLAMGDQDTFSQMEKPALKQFGALQSGLASRFSGMGTGGRHSSGFQNASNQATTDFASQLQGNRQNLQRQALMDLMGLSNTLLGQRPYDQFLAEKPMEQTPFLERLLAGLGGAGVGGATGYAAGGPWGAAAGAVGGFTSGFSASNRLGGR